jgi:hypothetical protein
VGEVPKDGPKGEGEEEKGDTKVGEEENGVAIAGEKEEEAEEEEDAGGWRGPTPRATSSSNSRELLITAHMVRTKSEPSEIALIMEWVWLVEAEVIWEGKRRGEVKRSTKRDSAERPAEAMEEKGSEGLGVWSGMAGTWEGRGRKVWNIRLRVVGVVNWFRALYLVQIKE